MSEQAKRFSKRQVRRQLSKAIQDLDSQADKVRGQIVITPRVALKGYVKWTAAIRRAARPLAEQFGLKAVVDNGKVVFS